MRPVAARASRRTVASPQALRIARKVNGVTLYTARSASGQPLSEYRTACGVIQWTRDVIYAGGRLLGAVAANLTEPTVAFVTASSSSTEQGVRTVDVRLTTSGGPSACPVSVAAAAVPGTAHPGADFTLTTPTLTFPAGSANGATLPLSVPIVGDAVDEPNETFSLTLSSVVGGRISGTAAHTVTITDDDPVPLLTVNDPVITEGDAESVTLTFTVALSVVSGYVVTVNYATAPNTATSGVDYLHKTGTVTFQPGAPTGLVEVTIPGDLLDEPNESLFVDLSGPTNATIANARGRRTVGPRAARCGVAHKTARVPCGQWGSLRASAPVKDLQQDGEAVSEKRVRRLMREEGLQGQVPKRFKQTTNSNHDHPIAANVLDRDFTAGYERRRPARSGLVQPLDVCQPHLAHGRKFPDRLGAGVARSQRGVADRRRRRHERRRQAGPGVAQQHHRRDLARCWLRAQCKESV